jgi:large subunit ribosomal protein L19
MDTTLLYAIEKNQLRTEHPDFVVGDNISVHNIIREGEKTRIQIFKGLVLAQKGSGLRSTFTVRKISDGIGVEKIFPLHSPNIKKIEINKRGSTRRAKIYYMRDRYGKSAMKVSSVTETKKAKLEKAAKQKAKNAPKETKEAETEEKVVKKAPTEKTTSSKAAKEKPVKTEKAKSTKTSAPKQKKSAKTSPAKSSK